jgi:hypothetical protein
MGWEGAEETGADLVTTEEEAEQECLFYYYDGGGECAAYNF